MKAVSFQLSAFSQKAGLRMQNGEFRSNNPTAVARYHARMARRWRVRRVAAQNEVV